MYDIQLKTSKTYYIFTGFHVKIYIHIIFLCIISSLEGNRVAHSSIRNVV